MSECVKCWLDVWFEWDDAVGSALSNLAIFASGIQILDEGAHVRRLQRALQLRREHYRKRPSPSCCCDTPATDAGGGEPKPLEALAALIASVEGFDLGGCGHGRIISDLCIKMFAFVSKHRPLAMNAAMKSGRKELQC